MDTMEDGREVNHPTEVVVATQVDENPMQSEDENTGIDME